MEDPVTKPAAGDILWAPRSASRAGPVTDTIMFLFPDRGQEGS